MPAAAGCFFSGRCGAPQCGHDAACELTDPPQSPHTFSATTDPRSFREAYGRRFGGPCQFVDTKTARAVHGARALIWR
jgi:hypothetical protein